MVNIEHRGATLTQPFYPLTEQDNEYFGLPAEGNNTYEYMTKNDAILITNSTMNENLTGIVFKPGDIITLRYFDGKEHTVELKIGAVSKEAVAPESPRTNFCMSDVTVKKLWKAMNTADSFFVSVENYEENGDQVEKEIRSLVNGNDNLSLRTLREQRLEDSGQIKKLKIQIYGISVFIILFSIFNLINTVISGIVLRKKELSMLESIGMEERQIRNMLFSESFLLALPNILITLTLGTMAGFGFISYMKESASYLEYQVPISAMVLYCIGMIVIPMIISFYCIKKQNKFSLVERIRNED